jgi:hypothetical protein
MTHNPAQCNACGRLSIRRLIPNGDCRFCRGLSCSECCKLAREVVWALHRLDVCGGSGTMSAMKEEFDTPGVSHDNRWPDKEALNECVVLGLMTRRTVSRGGEFKVWTITDAGRKFLLENPL